MIFKKSNLLILAAIVAFLTSCEKNDRILIEESESLITNKLSNDSEQFVTNKLSDDFKACHQLAKILSLAINKEREILSSSFENMAKQSEKDLEIDVEFFYHLEKNKPLPNMRGSTLLSTVQKYGRLNRSSANFSNVPGLSVLLEGNLESKAYNSRVYVDDGFDDSNPESLIYFYENGKLGSHAISETSKTKVFVVRISEAYAEKGSLRYERQQKANKSSVKTIGKTESGELISVISNKMSATKRANKMSPWPCNEPCDRDCNNQTENLRKFRTGDKHESWRGKGEFYWLIIWADDVQYSLQNGGLVVTGNPLQSSNTGEFGSVKEDRDYYPDFNSIIWDLNTDGNRMKYVNYEADGGSQRFVTVPLSVTFSPDSSNLEVGIDGNISFRINNGDDFVGETIVEYCHDLLNGSENHGFQYNYDEVNMWINNR